MHCNTSKKFPGERTMTCFQFFSTFPMVMNFRDHKLLEGKKEKKKRVINHEGPAGLLCRRSGEELRLHPYLSSYLATSLVARSALYVFFSAISWTFFFVGNQRRQDLRVFGSLGVHSPHGWVPLLPTLITGMRKNKGEFSFSYNRST